MQQAWAKLHATALSLEIFGNEACHMQHAPHFSYAISDSQTPQTPYFLLSRTHSCHIQQWSKKMRRTRPPWAPLKASIAGNATAWKASSCCARDRPLGAVCGGAGGSHGSSRDSPSRLHATESNRIRASDIRSG